MARIELRDVSLKFTDPNKQPVGRLFQIRRERNLEDLPNENQHDVLALDRVNLIIPHGRTFAVVGPSGCGKSSLLRTVAGLAPQHTGHVLYDGVDMKEIPPKERYIGMVFQNYALYPNFNSEGNLSFYFKINEISDEKTRERIQYTSEIMGMGFEELLPRETGTLSGGEKQRVAVARAIVRDPKLFLLDEPLSNLDAKLRLQTRTEIKRLLHKFRITTLYVTHDQQEAIALGDEIVVMHSGKIEQVGTYQNLTENPVSIFVAGFLGLPPMNLLSHGSILDGKLIFNETQIPIPERIQPTVNPSNGLTLGFRHNNVRVSAEKSSGNGIQLQGKVDALEPDYAQRTQLVYIRNGLLNYIGLCPLNMQLNIGQTVYAEIDFERLYFFDTKTGLRL